MLDDSLASVFEGNIAARTASWSRHFERAEFFFGVLKMLWDGQLQDGFEVEESLHAGKDLIFMSAHKFVRWKRLLCTKWFQLEWLHMFSDDEESIQRVHIYLTPSFWSHRDYVGWWGSKHSGRWLWNHSAGWYDHGNTSQHYVRTVHADHRATCSISLRMICNCDGNLVLR